MPYTTWDWIRLEVNSNKKDEDISLKSLSDIKKKIPHSRILDNAEENYRTYKSEYSNQNNNKEDTNLNNSWPEQFLISEFQTKFLISAWHKAIFDL